MNCRYCQEECQPIIQGPLPNGSYENRVAQCIPCNVGYFKDFHTVHCWLNEKDYYVIYSDQPDHWTTVYCVGPRIHEIALAFEFHVEFTPANIKNKLSTYLLFS